MKIKCPQCQRLMSGEDAEMVARVISGYLHDAQVGELDCLLEGELVVCPSCLVRAMSELVTS